MDWKADLEQLREELPLLHNSLFHNISREEFDRKIDALKATDKGMTPHRVVVEFAKLIALIGDAHTTLEVPRSKMLPLKFYCFDEGVYIIAAGAGQEELIHRRVLEIDGIPMEEVIHLLTEMIPHENFQFVKAQLPGHLASADILYGIGIAKSVEAVELTVEEESGQRYKTLLSSIAFSAWETLEPAPTFSVTEEELPLYRRNARLNYWSAIMEDGQTLYVKYNKCKTMEAYPFPEFVEGLKKILTNQPVLSKIVIDFRNNSGGDSELFRPFLEWLGKWEKEKPGASIVTIVGRDTFSSALLNVYVLKFNTKSIFIGEPTGGKPNCYGEVGYFKLNESGLAVRYSTKYYYLIDDYTWDSFYPEVTNPVSIRDYLGNRDSNQF